MPSIWESLSGLQGMDEARIPWLGQLVAMLVASQPELRPYMRAAYGRAPQVGSRFDAPEELQQTMHRAQTEETTADPRLNPWIMENIPKWVRPQAPSMVSELAGQEAPMQEMIMDLLRAGPQTKVHYKDYPQMSPREYLIGVPYPEQPLRIQAPYSRAKRGYEMSELEAEERERQMMQRGLGGLQEKFPQQDIPTLQALKGIAGTGAVQRELYGKEPPEATAYARNLATQERNRMDFMRLRMRFGKRKMFDEAGMFLGSPQERIDYNRFKGLEQEFGEKDKTTGEIYQLWLKYRADYIKKDEGEKVMAGPAMDWPTYHAQFKGGKPQDTNTNEMGHTQEQIETYNSCRSAGGSDSECRAKAGM